MNSQKTEQSCVFFGGSLVKPMDQSLLIYCIPLGMMENEVFRMDYEFSSCTNNIHRFPIN